MASGEQLPKDEISNSDSESKPNETRPRRSTIQRPKIYYGPTERRSKPGKLESNLKPLVPPRLSKQLADTVPGRVYKIKINTKKLPVFFKNEPRRPPKPRLVPALPNYTELTVYARNIPLFRKICPNQDADSLAETDLISEAMKNSTQQLAKDLTTLRLVVRRLNGKQIKIKFIPVNLTSCGEPMRKDVSQNLGQSTDEADYHIHVRDENPLLTKLTAPWFCDSCFSHVDGSPVRGMKLRTYFAHYQHFTEVHGFTANPSRCEYCGRCMQEARLIYHRFTEHGILPPVGLLENLMCLECGHVSQSEMALQAHERLHRKGHQCSVCHEPFKAIQDLLRHLDCTSHQTEPRRSYTCPSLGCGQVFFRNWLLVIHMRMSHKELALRFDLEGWPPIPQHEDKLQLTLIEGGVSL